MKKKHKKDKQMLHIMQSLPDYTPEKMCFNQLCFTYSFYKNYQTIHDPERELCVSFVTRFEECVNNVTPDTIQECLDTLRELRDEFQEKYDIYYNTYSHERVITMKPFRVIYDGTVMGLESTRREPGTYEFEQYIEIDDYTTEFD